MHRGLALPLAALLTAALAVPASAFTTQAQPAEAERRPVAARADAGGPPNVVLITVDDMKVDDLVHMPRTTRALGRLNLTDFVSNHPLCCPARAELLTGQFGHHNGVQHNGGGGPWGGYQALKAKNNTFARWFKRGGYSTAIVGKFINGFRPPRDATPAGWTDFMPFAGDSYSAYGYKYLKNDRIRSAPSQLHTNDFVTRESEGLIRDYADDRDKPFLLWASYVAPHAMTDKQGRFGVPVPAARHRGTMPDVVPTSWSKPSYEDPRAREQARAFYEDAETAPSQREVRRAAKPSIRELNQARLESLQSVDEGVGRIVRRLGREGELTDTVLVFTSDNGFLMGEHGQMGKNSYYDESLRVPFLARGPGVDQGESAKGSMITDIAPSLAALAGVDVQRAVDGRSDLFSLDGGWSDAEGVLIQAGGDLHPWLWRGLRTSQWTYVRRVGGGTVLFDRQADPYQMDNVSGERPGTEEGLELLAPPAP